MPRFAAPTGQRPDYFDRNPVEVVVSTEDLSTAPAASTNRATYTVPAGKKAFVEMCSVLCERATAQTGDGDQQMRILVTPDGGSANNILQAFVTDTRNAVGDRDRIGVSGPALLLEGAVLAANTIGAGTGGTTDFVSDTKIVEFDA